jgi:molybdate transport system permease protein
MPVDWSPLWLSLRVAALSTAVSLALGLWLAWLPARKGIQVWISLPMALPPTVVGAWLLCVLTGVAVFNWQIAVPAAVVWALPFLAGSARAAFQNLDPHYANAARSLGATEWRVFWRISLPLASSPIVAAAALGFARILTELALVLVIAAYFPARGSPPAVPVLLVIAAVALAVVYAGHFPGLYDPFHSRRPRA